uniref:Bowman-Birk serine protease inhibitors family domain-containing protein n=1 Tax=Medicago truncatula TaxID=3880 RepID=I3T5N1_MEDTR|nr:unknown [Medicago truncatula]
MGLKMKIALLLFFLGLTTTIVDARFEPNSLITQVISNGVKSTCKPCCNNCSCTFSIPPQCRCKDVKPTCHSACKTCRCFESFPLKCDCPDITDFCYEPCNSTIAKAH